MNIKITISFLINLTVHFGSTHTMLNHAEENNALEIFDSAKTIPETLARIKAQQLIERRKRQKLFRRRSPDSLDFKIQYQKLLDDYTNFEENLSIIKKKPKASYSGINFAMTLEEIKVKLKEKFELMKKNDLIIS